MKCFIQIFILSVLLPLLLRAQVPQKMSYQAVIRNSNNMLLVKSPIGMKTSIVNASGVSVFSELYNPNPLTNDNGLVSLEIGTGIAINGNFSNIDWSKGPYYIKIETDPLGGTNYSIISQHQLLSVPYALYSANGVPGPQGPPGLKGDKGDTGSPGLQGAKGDKGDKGDIGATGPQGLQGSKGDKGDTGASGPQGGKGDKGDIGPTGSHGPKGDKGDTGATGSQGPQGPKGDKGDKGDTGATGSQGPQGTKGDKGDTGATGSQGPKGDKGDKGDTGAEGPQGPAGPPGADGAQGPAGPQGPAGNDGTQGPAGPQGPSGPTGPQGPPGSANMNGTTNYVVKFITPTSGGNSQIIDNGTNIYVGSLSNSINKFEVNTSSPYDAINGKTTGTRNGVYGEGNGNIGAGIYGRNLASDGTGSVAGGNGLTASQILVLNIGSGSSSNGTIYGSANFSTTTSSGINRAGGYFQTNNGGSFAYVGCITSNNVVRKIEGNGTVNTTIKDINGKSVVMSAPEAPENFFMDYGTSQLRNGYIHVDLDPNFTKNIIVNLEHPLRVFIQLEGDCNGTYVTNKTGNGFDVRELKQGTSSIYFSWFVTANRADEVLPDKSVSRYSVERFAPAIGPQPVTVNESNK